MRLTDEQRQMVIDNLVLAQKMAWRMRNHTYLEFDDLHSVCYEGLCIAAQKFHPDAGCEFPTFAFGVMQNTVRSENKIIRRRQKLNASYLADNDDAPAAIDISKDIECMEIVKGELRHFQGTQREKAAAILFVRNPEMSQSEIADKAGISPKTVYTAIKNFRQQIRQALAV